MGHNSISLVTGKMYGTAAAALLDGVAKSDIAELVTCSDGSIDPRFFPLVEIIRIPSGDLDISIPIA